MLISTKSCMRAAVWFIFFGILYGSGVALCVDGRAEAIQGEQTVHLLEISSFDGRTIDTICALPEVEGWVELGRTLILSGKKSLKAALSRVAPEAHLKSVSAAGRNLLLARFNASGNADSLPRGAELLLGCGRYGVFLVEPAAGKELHKAGFVLEPMPWNSALIQRLDRAYPQPAGAADSEIVAAAIEAFDPDSYAEVVTDLVGFGTRYTHNSSFPDVTNYLRDELQAMGYTVTLDPFQISGKTRHNVICEIPGDVTPDDVYIVCGHCDSTSPSPSTNAPGADDNASGTAGVIEMARALKQYRFDSTVRFICFSGEEQGLVGSSAYVDDLIRIGQLNDVKGVLNMDMIAYLNTSVWDVLLEGEAGVSSQYLNLLSDLVPLYTDLTAFISTNPYGSDHMPFIYEDINAVLTIEYEDWYNPYYHSTGDVVSTLTLPFAGEIVKLNIAATAIQAGIKGGYMLRYGEGLAGSSGFIPHIAGSGSTNLGDDFTLTLNECLGGASSMLVLGMAEASLPFRGGTFLVDPVDAVFFPLPLGGSAGVPGAGSLILNFTTPNDPALTGVSTYTQLGVFDAGAIMGLSLSNGLKATFGL
ncbi:MAG: M28 family peptidase [Planctomycetes bacterium]|nr:M28 family peptidase [Planctomycetota bacterium]